MAILKVARYGAILGLADGRTEAEEAWRWDLVQLRPFPLKVIRSILVVEYEQARLASIFVSSFIIDVFLFPH